MDIMSFETDFFKCFIKIFIPNAQKCKSNNLQRCRCFHRTATGSVIKIHVIIAIHIKKNLCVML